VATVGMCAPGQRANLAPMPAPLRLPSIDGLRAFEAAARLGTFERAAQELAVTASAVGKRLAALEELLGQPLFERGAKALVLTVAGREYLQQAGAALALLAAMPQHQARPQAMQRLRVTTPPTFARQVLVPALESFTQAQPQIELEVLLSIPFLHGSGPEADVEVRHGDVGTVLMHDCVLPLASPALLRSLPPLRQPADLALAPLLRTPIEPWLPWFRAAGLAWPEPCSGPKLVDLGLTLEAAVCGQGIALGRPTLARPWLAAGSLVPLFDIRAQPTHQYRLLPHGDGAAAVFARWLHGVCAGVEAEALALLSGDGGKIVRAGAAQGG
jgi:LysR family transcriptional regulator, glycine cleavage system transcriptional activator